MKDCHKRIAGLTIRFSYHESASSKVLFNELRYYEDIDADTCDVEFCFFEPEQLTFTSNNPSSQVEFSDGFGVNWGGYSVYWHFGEGSHPKVFFFLNVAERWLKHKLKGMQYTHPYEEIGQIFHEGVLQPTLFLCFSETVALVHGSAVKSDIGKTVVFGGTGGVGKTSLELELVLNRNYSFVADDITIVDKNGLIYPNFNLPKIYGYNLIGYKEIEKKLLNGKSFSDRMWWRVQKSLRKPNRFRRRADIDDFYNAQKSSASALNEFYILFRSNVRKPKVSKISSERAVEMNAAVMYTELTRVHNALKLHQFNRKKSGSPPLLSFDGLMKNSSKTLSGALEKAECFMLEVPMDFAAGDVKEQIPDLLQL